MARSADVGPGYSSGGLGAGAGSYGGDIFALVRKSIEGGISPDQAGWLAPTVPATVAWTPGSQTREVEQSPYPSALDVKREWAAANSPQETPGPWHPADTTPLSPGGYDERLVPGSRWVKEGDDPASGQVYMYWGNNVWGDESAPWAPYPHGPASPGTQFWQPSFSLVPAGWPQWTMGWAKETGVKKFSPIWYDWSARDRHGADKWYDEWTRQWSPSTGQGPKGCVICGSASHTTAEHWTPNYPDVTPKFADVTQRLQWRR